jgi:fructose-1,6-bisphosphatase/inositol monophosphatase family enzyme
LVRRVKKVRIFGSTGLDMAHVAMGHLSALIQLNVQIWDIAAALVILKESGVMYDVRPTPLGGWQFIAAVPSLFKPLKTIFDAVQ